MEEDKLDDHHQNGIDEEEAELYDRQIRLWGVEMQNRMRRSSVLIINFRGISAEACKNIVLAGVGSITILDNQIVQPEDLGAGFFFRDEDIGKLRVDAAKDRVKSLNPRVDVIGQTEDPETLTMLPDFMNQFDIVCLTDSNSQTMIKVNSLCRKAGKPLFCAGSFGINGYIFSDLIDHTYLMDLENPLPSGEIKRSTKKGNQKFIPFELAIKSKLHHVTPRRMKKVSPMLWAVLTLLEYQLKHDGKLPAGLEDTKELVEICEGILNNQQADKKLIPTNLLRLSVTCEVEFTPTCSIIGSILSQEILNVLGGKQIPLVNFFIFDGQRSSGDLYSLGLERTE